jgi:hypothetical protein
MLGLFGSAVIEFLSSRTCGLASLMRTTGFSQVRPPSVDRVTDIPFGASSPFFFTLRNRCMK